MDDSLHHANAGYTIQLVPVAAILRGADWHLVLSDTEINTRADCG